LPKSSSETQVHIAGRTLPMSVVGRLYNAIRESLNAQDSKDAVALWNAIIIADKRSKGIPVQSRRGAHQISAARLDELLAADAAQVAA
jgi:hypothetical protein